MKVLVATEKPFAKAAVDGIKSIINAAGGEVVLLEKYTDVEQFYAAVADVDALIVRSDKVTKEVLEKAKDFVKALPELSHEEQENLAKKMAEDLGIKLGDFMMPIRMAVTGSRVSPPLMGSILILGVEKSIERIERTLKAF